MGMGSWSVDLDYSPEMAAELIEVVGNVLRPRKNHMLAYDPDGNLTYVGVVLAILRLDEGGITIGGRNALWWLDGPVTPELDYVSQQNKLSDGDFSLDLVSYASGPFWDFADNSQWSIGGGAAQTFGATDKDDILRSAETFHTVAGRAYQASIRLNSTGAFGPGHFRLRIAYQGKFQNPNLASPYSAWGTPARTPPDIHFETDPQGIVAGPVLRVQTALPNLIPNGSFDDGGGSLNGYIQTGATGNFYLGTDGGHNGPNYCFTNSSTTPPLKVLWSSASGSVSGSPAPQPVLPGQEYEMWMVARTNPGFTDTDGDIFLDIVLDGPGMTPKHIETPHARPDAGSSAWRLLHVKFSVDPGYYIGTPVVLVQDQTLGQWDFDDISLIRVKGNYDAVQGPAIIQTPERSYRWDMPYRVDISVTDAIVQMRAVAVGLDRTPIIIDGPSLSPNVDAPGLQVASFDVRLPSGYVAFYPQVYIGDVHAGAYFLGQGTIVDTDSSTYTIDTDVAPAAATGGIFTRSSIAPAGAESVHLELVAESSSGPWIAHNASFIRTDSGPVDGDQIIADIRIDPVTGLPLSLDAGTISCPEGIPYDWVATNLSALERLNHYCTVISDPPREYRVNPGFAPTLDVGIAEDVCTDHTPVGPSPIVLLKRDIDVVDIPPTALDVDTQPTEIWVIGAERKLRDGRTIVITANALVPGSAEVDFHGFASRRTEIVTDGTVDHIGYAQALATDIADRAAAPAPSVTVKLNPLDAATAATLDSYTRPDCPPGDWVYVYHPEAGLQDPDNETTIEGAPAFPVRLRIYGRQRQLGPSSRVALRRTNGSVLDPLPGVLFSDEDSTTLMLGDRPPDWMSDPQGGNPGVQYVSDRKSRPR